MAQDAELTLIFTALHLIGLGLVTLLLVMFLRSESAPEWTPPEEGGGDGGGNDRVPSRGGRGPGGGGLPLPDAGPARVRLREPGRLADLLPGRERRPAHVPGDPARRLPVSTPRRGRSPD